MQILKIYFATVCLLLMGGIAFSQGINYESTFEKALDKASQTGKPIFLIINPPRKAMKGTQVNALNNKDIIKLFNDKYVSYAVSIDDSVARPLRNKYYAQVKFPSYVFLNSKGEMAYKALGISPNPNIYRLYERAGSSKITAGKTLNALDEQYKSGKYPQSFLYDYIAQRINFGITDNAQPLEDYVNSLNIKALDNYYTVLFILKAGPVINSKVYNLIYSNTKKNVDSIFKKEPQHVQEDINDAIFNNTIHSAIVTKNDGLANQAASFLSMSFKKNYIKGNRAYQRTINDYYKAINDTSKFYRRAGVYYDEFMRISVDSIARQRKNSAAKQVNEQIDTSATSMMLDIYNVPSVCDCDVPMVLNSGAWDYYKFGTKNPDYLTKAIAWSRRSIALEPDNARYYDTLAHLLYRFGLYADAESNENRAIRLAKSNKMPNDELMQMQADLKKIKSRKL